MLFPRSRLYRPLRHRGAANRPTERGSAPATETKIRGFRCSTPLARPPPVRSSSTFARRPAGRQNPRRHPPLGREGGGRRARRHHLPDAAAGGADRRRADGGGLRERHRHHRRHRARPRRRRAQACARRGQGAGRPAPHPRLPRTAALFPQARPLAPHLRRSPRGVVDRNPEPARHPRPAARPASSSSPTAPTTSASCPRPGTHIRRIAANENGDDIYRLLGGVANKLVSQHWRVFCDREQYDNLLAGRDDRRRQLIFHALLDPCDHGGLPQRHAARRRRRGDGARLRMGAARRRRAPRDPAARPPPPLQPSTRTASC